MICWNEAVLGVRLEPDSHASNWSLSCMACGRSVVIRHDNALAIWGEGVTTLAMAKSLACSACGARKGQVMKFTQHAEFPGPYPEVTPASVAALRLIGPTMARRMRATAQYALARASIPGVGFSTLPEMNDD